MPRLFGTDGIRGAFGAEPLDRATVTALGVALGQELGRAGGEPFVVLAGDTRDSTPTLAAWLASGLGRANVAVRFGGVLPTPAVAFLARRLGAACGVAISASHNPHPDNGIKLIDAAGYKWSPENEAAIESALIALRPAVAAENEPSPPSLEPDPELGALYRRFLLEAAPGPRCLAGLRIALDLANGAAYRLAPDLFTRLGAEVEVFAAEPDGTNINRGCGSTHPEALAARLRAGGFDLGVAFDGDADRAILVDETGEIRDGDAILYLWADALAGEGRLSPARLVATSMSNLGLERALGRLGVGVERCNVGDREVVATLLAEGLTLGGEQSGHIVNLELATTGDGLQTALHLAAIVARSGRSLATLLGDFERFPQVLTNVRVQRREPLESLPGVAEALAKARRELGLEGRVVLRFSGTEPLARVMIEGPDQRQIENLAGSIAAAVAEALG